jgi:hypothetical protein
MLITQQSCTRHALVLTVILTLGSILSSCNNNNNAAPVTGIPDNYIECTINGVEYKNMKIAQTLAPLSNSVANSIFRGISYPVPSGLALQDTNTFNRQRVQYVAVGAIFTASNKDTLFLTLVAFQQLTANRIFQTGSFSVRQIDSNTALPLGGTSLRRLTPSNNGISPNDLGYNSGSSPNDTGSIQITSVGNIGEQIKGTFSCTISNEAKTTTIEIKDGKFSVQRSAP